MTSYTEQARALKAQDPSLSADKIAKIVGCHRKTAYDALLPPEVRREKNRHYQRQTRKRTRHYALKQVTRVTVEQDGSYWHACVNGRPWGSSYVSKNAAEDVAEWLRWPKTEKGKAA